MTESIPKARDVQIVTKGPYGGGVYQEGPRSDSFPWQFGGGEIAMIQLTPASEWDEQHQWAAGRRDAVVERMVSEVVRQKCRECVPSIAEEDGKSWVYFRLR